MKVLLLLLSFLAATLAFAQLSYRGEIEAAGDLSFASTNQVLNEGIGLSLRGHLEATYSLDPLDFRLVLDPAVRVTSGGIESTFGEPGLTEAFGLYRLAKVDFSAGLERLPLETARLSVPFRVEPVNRLGQPLGLLGVRANVYLEDWRVRPALLYRTQDDQLGGVLSVRREFASFDLEAHLLYLDGFAAGLGGSGLVGDIVVYGEAWLLANPWDGRGALGASGFWGDLLWTLEAAYAADPLDTATGTELDFEETLLNTAKPYPQLLGQLSSPVGGAGNLDLNASFGLVDGFLGGSSALQTISSLLYTYSESDYEVRVGPTFSRTEFATVYGLRFGVTGFF